MRRFFRHSMVLCALLSVAAGGFADQQYSEVFDQTYSLDAGGTVALDNVNGDVSIEVWERPEVQVRAVKKASSQELLDGLKINVKADGSAVRIDTDYPSTRGQWNGERVRLEVEYTLTVPRSAALDDIDLVNGNLSVVGVEGGIQAESVNGTIVVRDSAGDANLSTVNGGIELYVDRLGSDDKVGLESVNGFIDLYLSGSVGADLRAESVNGGIQNAFGLEVHKGKYVGSDLQGTVGGGGARVEIETVNGKIAVLGW
jgi:DUF4097 and DUF4098 domain-containing protein YvlB